MDGTEFGSQANYSCDEGYVVSGNSSRVCQADGEWSGNDPNCDRRFNVNFVVTSV